MLYGIIIGLVVGIVITALVVRPKLKQTATLDQEIISKNDKARNELSVAQQLYQQKSKELEALQNKLGDIMNVISEKQKSADEYADNYLKSKLETAELQFENSQKEIEEKYTKATQDCENTYLITLQEAAEEFQKEIEVKKEELAGLVDEINRQQAAVNAAVELNKRAAAEKDKADFYRLVLSEEDLKEIKELKELLVHFRNPEPLNKVIWKCYYEKPYTDLIGRVVGSDVKTGIYKITNIASGMCYVGQSVNIADRWKQHIKRGMGAETPTRNKLYPAMLKEGVENFTFEIIEECDRADLDEKEKYWTDFYKAQEFGYSVRRG